MPNTRAQRRNSVVDLLSKVPVNRGSLLKSIENLLKTIETSENAVMIPTLLRDKCDFDAWELLFVAKILKASILGHSDLVEFYMNHIGHSTNHLQAAAVAAGAAAASSSSSSSLSGNNQQNGFCNNSNCNSNNIDHHQQQQQQQQYSPSPSTNRSHVSPILSSPNSITPDQQNGLKTINNNNLPQQINVNSKNDTNQSPTLSPLSPVSSNSSVTTTTTTTTNGANNNNINKSTTSSSLNSWTTAASNSQNLIQQTGTSASISSSTNSSTGSSFNESFNQESQQQQQQHHHHHHHHQIPDQIETLQQAVSATAAAARPLLSIRQAQPPSLLQLTTNNNHINSMAAVAAGFTSNNIEQLTSKLNAMQTNYNDNSSTTTTTTTPPPTQSNGLDGALSISTSISSPTANTSTGNGSNQQQLLNGVPVAPASNTIVNGIRMEATAELRTSRSAGCLFRLNSSGASSPRTPTLLQTPTNTTPYPQAETLANNLANGLSGDPSAPVKLLLQIEQLKSSISHVTNLLESVVELYKKSIDNIAMA